MVAPLAVTIATMPWPCFLKPNVLVGVREACVWGSERVCVRELVVDVRLVETDCFFASSAASEGERFKPFERGERCPFSETLTSSVLPARHTVKK